MSLTRWSRLAPTFVPAPSTASPRCCSRPARGRIEAAKALLAAGSDVNEALPNGVTALLLAITNVNYELAAILLREGADANSDAVGWSALHQLAWSRRPPRGFNNPERVHRDNVDGLDLARQLLTRGADPNSRSKKDSQDVPRQRSTGGPGGTPFFLLPGTAISI